MLGRTRSLKFKLFGALFLAGSVSSLFASSTLPSCSTASLASYVTSTANGGGCAIGILDYYNVSYLPGTNAPASSNIQVTPGTAGFSFGPVTAAPGQTVQFEIDYQIFIDPAPVITGDDLKLDPPSGDITVTEYFCNDLPFNPGPGAPTCLGGSSAQSLTVGNGNAYPSEATIAFAPPASRFQEVEIVFTLVGGTNGASFDGLDSASILNTVPEPASFGFALLGLAGFAGYKLRKRHSR